MKDRGNKIQPSGSCLKCHFLHIIIIFRVEEGVTAPNLVINLYRTEVVTPELTALVPVLRELSKGVESCSQCLTRFFKVQRCILPPLWISPWNPTRREQAASCTLRIPFLDHSLLPSDLREILKPRISERVRGRAGVRRSNPSLRWYSWVCTWMCYMLLRRLNVSSIHKCAVVFGKVTVLRKQVKEGNAMCFRGEGRFTDSREVYNIY